MKKLYPLIAAALLCFTAGNCYCQTDTAFFDGDWKTCNRSNAKYYRIVTRQVARYIIKDVYISNNSPQMIAFNETADISARNGKFTYFNEDGTKQSEGIWRDNIRTGTWRWWYDGGKDSTVATYNDDGSVTYLYKGAHREKALMFVEQMPTYPGGEEALHKFLQTHIRYPKEANKNHTEGTVVIQFVVEADGSVDEIKVLRGVEGGCNEEAIRVINMMPRWQPGKQNGTAVPVYFNLPISFTLDDGKKKKK